VKVGDDVAWTSGSALLTGTVVAIGECYADVDLVTASGWKASHPPSSRWVVALADLRGQEHAARRRRA
jgi:hypothetical protein